MSNIIEFIKNLFSEEDEGYHFQDKYLPVDDK